MAVEIIQYKGAVIVADWSKECQIVVRMDLFLLIIDYFGEMISCKLSYL